MGLIPQPPGRVAGGSVRFEGTELIGLDKRALNELRGNAIAMIFQEPMSSLNPAFTIGEQIVEGLLRHRRIGRAEAEARAVEMLARVPHSRRRPSASTTIRTSSRAGCASAR
jgi:ABC-type microcin C transport system duplicated ATPase subunit YejF